MEINNVRLAAGDSGEMLKLARSIKKSEPRDKNAHPLASQFFDGEPSNVRQLSTQELLESMAGADNIERIKWIDALAAGGYGAIALTRPEVAGDVSEIGLGRVGSGWTAPKPSVTSGAKALLLNRLANAAQPSAGDTNVLVESLKAIVFQLLGVSAESLDPATLKVKLTQAIKAARPDVQRRLAKALGVGSQPSNVPEISLADLVALGAKVEKQGSRLLISV
jgi:hypothetical protein